MTIILALHLNQTNTKLISLPHSAHPRSQYNLFPLRSLFMVTNSTPPLPLLQHCTSHAGLSILPEPCLSHEHAPSLLSLPEVRLLSSHLKYCSDTLTGFQATSLSQAQVTLHNAARMMF